MISDFVRRAEVLIGFALLASTLSAGQENSDARRKAERPTAGCAPEPFSEAARGRPELREGQSLARLSTTPGFVEVPVTVKDASGRLVDDLPSCDFAVYENGVMQKLTFFSSQPLPLSTAIVIGDNLPSPTLDEVIQSLPALMSMFRKFDEAAFYAYGESVQQLIPFVRMDRPPGGMKEQLKRIKDSSTVADGVPGAVQEENVLNDAILRAAQDLSARDGSARRRVILVIGEGRENGSTARYADVQKLLLSFDISVYALGVETAATLQPAVMPGLGDGSALQKYAEATGGDSFASFNKKSIEHAYLTISNQVRHQYTLGYVSPAAPGKAYRSIDVHVHHPNWGVTAKIGYYARLGTPASPSP